MTHGSQGAAHDSCPPGQEQATLAAMPGAPPTLVTRSGVIEGCREDGLVVFRGVSFAAPPVGARRFAAPAREEPWDGVRPAHEPGPASLQRPSLAMRLLGLEEFAQDEDCLTLQVWTPGLDAGRRPVLVWLHGGGFTAGAGSLPLFDGASLAARGDVVVVTLNYRLGALGFLPLPALLEAGLPGANFGLLDQLAALDWVREHAARLGGDPDNVTLFGESAGAMSIGALLGAPAARGRFHRAILQSGAAHHVSPRAAGLRIAELFRDALGCSSLDVDALRALPAEALLDAQQRVVDEAWRHVEGLAFQPVVDGALLPRPPLETIAAGAARDVALLVGTNRDEWRLFALTDTKVRSLDESALLRRLARSAPGTSGTSTQGVGSGDPARRAPSPDPEAFARRAVDIYTEARRGRAPVDPPALWLALQTDRVFRIPAIRLAERQCAHAPHVHVYRFDWTSPALGGALGACHGLEIPFVFGTLRHPRAAELAGAGPAAERLASAMQSAWISFARSGDPGWAAYELPRRATRRFGADSGLEFDPEAAERAFWDGLL
jgi:para-nitrobenzyl esterase